MRTQSFISNIVLVLMLLMAGCAAPATQPPAPQALPTQPLATQVPPTQSPVNQEIPQSELNTNVVLNMVERLNAGDVDGSLAYFADDAIAYLMGFPPTGIEIYNGKEQIRSLWQGSVDNHFEWNVKVTDAMGNIVGIQSKTWHDFTRQLEVAPLEYIDVYEVIDGKIQTYGSWLTDDALARFKPAFAAVVPPEPTALPFSGSPATEMTVTTVEGTCTTDAPLALKSGDMELTWNVQDQDQDLYALTLFTLDPGKDLLDLMVSTVGAPPSWGDMVLLEELGPGESKTYSFKLENGPLYIICWSMPPDLPIGNSGPIPVVK